MPIFVYTKFKILLIFLKKYVNISEKERKENMKNKAKTIIAFLIMGLVLFIGIIAERKGKIFKGYILEERKTVRSSMQKRKNSSESYKIQPLQSWKNNLFSVYRA